MTGFVGANPVALAGLADTLGQYAARIRSATRTVETALDGAGRSRITSVLGVVAAALDSEADELDWRAEAIAAAQNVLAAPLLGQTAFARDKAEFAALAVFDLATWEQAYSSWRTLPDPDELATLTPKQVAGVFAGLAPSLAEAFAHRHSSMVGGLDGAPPQLRYTANRVLMAQTIDELQQRVARVRADSGRSWLKWLAPSLLIPWYSAPALNEALAEHLEQRIAEYQLWLDEGRQILLFDPSGDGRVAEVFGNLETAQHVGVLIPGMSNDMRNFSDGDGGFRTNAAQLWAASRDLGTPDVATVAWLGYDTPDNVGAAALGAARAGAPQLIQLLAGVAAGAEQHVTVIAHSYGSVLAGMAASAAIAADDLVFVGSPGTTLDEAADARLRGNGRVWSALADGDPIGAGVSPEELVPPVWVPAPLAPSWVALDLFANGADELWHGTNPVADEFGAVRIATDGSSGHSEYFEEGSLRNLARIVVGRYRDVELVE